MRKPVRFVLLMGVVATAAAAGGPAATTLPAPRTDGGLPLMEALKARHSSREFSPRPLPAQVLSNILWAANGVNRPASGKRTAPSAKDMREIAVYAVTADGAFLFDPDKHALRRIADGDLRALTGVQDFVVHAPLNLVYVADTGRMNVGAEDQRFYSQVDAGFVAENVYLYCASAGLATVVRASIDRPALAAALGLKPEQRIILAQTVGYPR